MGLIRIIYSLICMVQFNLFKSLSEHSLNQTYPLWEFIEPRLDELLNVEESPHGINLFLQLIIERQ